MSGEQEIAGSPAFGRDHFAAMVRDRREEAERLASQWSRTGSKGLANPQSMTDDELTDALWGAYESQALFIPHRSVNGHPILKTVRGPLGRRPIKRGDPQPVRFGVIRLVWDALHENPCVWGFEDRVRRKILDELAKDTGGYKELLTEPLRVTAIIERLFGQLKLRGWAVTIEYSGGSRDPYDMENVKYVLTNLYANSTDTDLHPV